MHATSLGRMAHVETPYERSNAAALVVASGITDYINAWYEHDVQTRGITPLRAYQDVQEFAAELVERQLRYALDKLQMRVADEVR
jgi:hypothetical protein